MIITVSRKIFTFFVCLSLLFSPVLHAGQLSLPASDLVAPKISQAKYIDTVEKDKNHRITVEVTDNVAVKQVTLYYRVIGTETYKTQNMKNISGSDDFVSTISSDDIKSPGVEYYIQAMDQAGNTLLHGYSFSPLSVKTVAAGSMITSSQKQSGASDIDVKDDSIFSNKWFWIGVGVLVIGAASGGGGGGGGAAPTATLTVNTAEPITP